MKSKELQQAIDNAVSKLGQFAEIGSIKPWLNYWLETIEEELGEETLHDIMSALEERLEKGGW